MNNRDKLFDYISKYKLDKAEVAELVRVKPDTVSNWMVSHESNHFEEMPDMAIELLELKLKDRPVPENNE